MTAAESHYYLEQLRKETEHEYQALLQIAQTQAGVAARRLILEARMEALDVAADVLLGRKPALWYAEGHRRA